MYWRFGLLRFSEAAIIQPGIGDPLSGKLCGEIHGVIQRTEHPIGFGKKLNIKNELCNCAFSIKLIIFATKFKIYEERCRWSGDLNDNTFFK
jgi:hypothetical protein